MVNNEADLISMINELKQAQEIAVDLEVNENYHCHYFPPSPPPSLGSLLPFLPRVCVSHAGLHKMEGLHS